MFWQNMALLVTELTVNLQCLFQDILYIATLIQYEVQRLSMTPLFSQGLTFGYTHQTHTDSCV